MDEVDRDQPLNLGVVRALAKAGQISPQDATVLADATAAPPRPSDWMRFLSWFLAFAGTALTLAGVVFFFAYNWVHLGKLGKFGLLEVCIVGATAGAWKLGDKIGGRALLLAAVILVGPVLAVYGQTYQTGADPYELFLAWAVLTLPWVVLARIPALWITTLLLVNTTFILFWEQILDRSYQFGESVLGYLTLATLNIVPWAAWEMLQQRRIPWLTPRWPARVMALAACGTLVVCLSAMSLGEASDTAGFGVIAVIVGLAVVVGSILYYRTHLPDLFMMALAATSVMTVATISFGHFLLDEVADSIALLVLGLFVVAEVSGTAMWLRREAGRMSRIRAELDKQCDPPS